MQRRFPPPWTVEEQEALCATLLATHESQNNGDDTLVGFYCQ